VKALKPQLGRFPVQGKSLANRSGFVLHFLLVTMAAAGRVSAFAGKASRWALRGNNLRIVSRRGNI